MTNKNQLIRACDASKTVRGFSLVCTDLVQEAIDIHGCSPIAGMAFGRLLMGALLMGDTLKGDKETLTLRVKGDGELGTMLAVVDSKGHVRGTLSNPLVLNSKSVGEAVGKGTLTVIRDMGLKEPYNSTVKLQTGEIGDDLAYYYASSEQTPSAMAFAVIYDRETLKIKVAGGFFVQLMPDCPEPYQITIEENISWMGNVSKVLDEEPTAEHLLRRVMDGLDIEVMETKEVSYKCNCSKERVERALLSIPKEELISMRDDDKPVELVCEFCNTKYSFSKEEIQKLIDLK